MFQGNNGKSIFFIIIFALNCWISAKAGAAERYIDKVRRLNMDAYDHLMQPLISKHETLDADTISDIKTQLRLFINVSGPYLEQMAAQAENADCVSASEDYLVNALPTLQEELLKEDLYWQDFRKSGLLKQVSGLLAEHMGLTAGVCFKDSYRM